MAVLQLNSINKVFAGEFLLEDITFSVDEKDRIGLVGLNGCGKTTLLKIILEEENHDENLKTMKRGDIVKKRGMKIGYLSQHFDLKNNNTIFEEMMEIFSHLKEIKKEIDELNGSLSWFEGEELEKKLERLAELNSRYEHEDGYNSEYKIKQILNGLGFTEEENTQKIEGLSGGQKSRVALAKLLIESPELLILDEPTNHLDINAIEWLEKFLKNYNKAFILVSHDRYFLDNVTNRIFEIENKILKSYTGNFSLYIEQKELQLKSDLRAYEKEQEKVVKMEEFIRRYKAGVKCRQARGREKILNRMELMDNPVVGRKDMKIKFETTRNSSDKVVELKNICKKFENKDILKDINCKIYRGQRIGIIGKNGTGKSTLLKIISRKLEYEFGEIIEGTKIDLGYYDQHHLDLNIENTIFEELVSNFKLLDEEARSLAGSFLFTEEEVFKKIKNLSGGERARVSLMKLMLSKPNFLILDEPTNHLDIYSREVLEESLEEYDGTMVVVSHDRHFLENLVDIFYEIKDGKLSIFNGDYDSYKQKDIIKNGENVVEKVENTISYEEQKKIKNRINSLEKKILEFEKKIEQKENEKLEFEKKYEDAGKKNMYGEIINAQENLEKCDLEILNLMEEWEKMEAELKELLNK